MAFEIPQSLLSTVSDNVGQRVICEDPVHLDEVEFLLVWRKMNYDLVCEMDTKNVVKDFKFSRWLNESFNGINNRVYQFGPSRAFAYVRVLDIDPFSKVSHDVQVLLSTVRVDIRFDGTTLAYVIHGSNKAVTVFKRLIDAMQWETEATFINWVTAGPQGLKTTKRRLVVPKYVDGQFPWLTEATGFQEPGEFFKAFLKSSENILIIYGDPGTGKSTLLRLLIEASGADATYSSDPKVIGTDDFFSDFLSEDDSNNDSVSLLVMEDCDVLLSSRKTTHNEHMSRFLNTGDGLVSSHKKKLVFTTNLTNLNDIDDALLRPGRCYAAIKARRLDRDEAIVVHSAYFGKDYEFTQNGHDFSIAEVLNDPNRNRTGPKKKSIGFTN